MVSTAFSQSIKVSGTVKDAANKPVANAIVELLRAKHKDTTGADGAYSLNVTTSALGRPAVSSSGEVSLQKGVLELATAQAAPIRIEIFDVQGNLLDRLAMEMASAGIYRLNLAGRVRSQNMIIVKASVGRTTKAFPYLPAGYGAAPANFSPEFSAGAGVSLAKVSAAADTLRFTASGFAAKTVELNSVDTTVNVILEASGDYWGGLKNPPVKSAGCGKATTVTNGKKTITSNNQSRSYINDIPTNYDMNKPYRLFYISHWVNGTAEQMQNNNYYNLKPVANAANEPAIFIAPQGIGGTWGQVDHALFDNLVAYAEANLCIDVTRIFATGFSMGGMVSYSLSTAKQKKIRAAVGMGPANYNIWLPNPKLTDPIAWMQTTGMADPLTPWVNNDAQKRGAKYIALEKAADNGCAIPAGNNIPTWTSGPHLCYDFQGCKPGYPVKVCTFNGAHTEINRDPGSNENWVPKESWKFFTQF